MMTNKKHHHHHHHHHHSSQPSEKRVLIIEPYYGGSHKRFIETLMPLSVDYDSILGDTLPEKTESRSSSLSLANKWPTYKFTLYEMSGKKWHWRARTSALYLSRVIKEDADKNFDVLFSSSVLNLAELIALRPDIGRIPFKIIYFHENQLVYPVQIHKERDFQYGYNEILSCLVADQIVFNSRFNRDSFLTNIRPFLKLMPDYRPPDIEQMTKFIELKSMVLYYPIKFSSIPLMHAHRREKKILHIIWPHRWEHDKNPEQFFEILFKLKEERNIPFKVSVLGESHSQVPAIFEEAKKRLSEEILHWGYVDGKQNFYEVLASGNVVISTAIHEFFGISMLEAAYCGCYPLCPSRLVYPEIFPEKYLYETELDLLDKLEEFGRSPGSIGLPLDIAYDVFDWIYCQDEYRNLLNKSPPSPSSMITSVLPATSSSSSMASTSSHHHSNEQKQSSTSILSKLATAITHHHNHHNHHQRH